MFIHILLYDLRQNRNMLALIFLCLAYFLYTLTSGSIEYPEFILFMALWASIIPLIFPAREDRFRTTATLCSLPVCRKDIFLCRYLECWLITIVLTVLMCLARLIIHGPAHVLPELLDWRSLFRALALVCLFYTLILPLLYRFGNSGLMIFLVVIQVLGLLAIVLSMPGAAGKPDGSIFGTALDAIRNLLNGWRSRLGEPAYYLAAAGLLLGIQFLSFRVSLALFRQREL